MSFDPNAPVAVVLAAGLGKRFRSPVPKVLHLAAGRPLIEHVLIPIEASGIFAKVIVVIGNGAPEVKAALAHHPSISFVEQTELLGTADAVRRCEPLLEGTSGPLLVMSGDTPLVSRGTIERLMALHSETNSQVSLVTAVLGDPAGYGRIVRSDDAEVVAIVEQADASEDQQKINEVSSGIWCFERTALFDALKKVSNANAQGEYYLPDAAMVMAREMSHIYTVMAEDPSEITGVNDREQLATASKALRRRIMQRLMADGVTIEDPDTTYIDDSVVVGRQSVIRPLTFLEGETRIGEGCSIGPSTRIVDSTIDDGAEVTFAVVKGSSIGRSASVGPFASLRPGTVLGPNSKVGTFVETKATSLGKGSKIPHLSYIGDAEIGTDSNIGAGTITCNYDGETKTKSKTVIGNDVLIGSDTMLVAPVRISDGAVTGAGSVVTGDIAEDEVAVGAPARTRRKRKPRPPTADTRESKK
ncbi:MAG: bifunctional UDP-N-acetylglucosamine diphosphorylase/glucosamine-1-phosphate N-acetyltransferase GlmU [Actinomycetota bacterium]|nr:bifunctional UDP-N-acetylglucosamine diphosphorylase/glucosamine-1-phosphate N-acetyltransferase GlmU [Actinomycetota bacterium]